MTGEPERQPGYVANCKSEKEIPVPIISSNSLKRPINLYSKNLLRGAVAKVYQIKIVLNSINGFPPD
jgi:hypothetical protein